MSDVLDTKARAPTCGPMLWGVDMTQVVLLSIVTASVAFTVTEAAAFLWLRLWVASWSSVLGKLFACSYCFGHWVAFGLTWYYRPLLFGDGSLLDYFLTALVVAWLAGWQAIALSWLMQRAGK